MCREGVVLKGIYAITVKNNVLQYKFEIRRNITIIKGDSATGKTTLIDMIREFYDNGELSGVSLSCEKQCIVLEGRQWNLLLANIHDSIVFIDEGNSFVATDDFADAIKHSDNYFVIVTREALPNLPYSVEEIYGIRASGKYGSLQQTYQEFYHIYGDIAYNTEVNPDIVIVEDSNSGYEFFTDVAQNQNYKVVSAEGKSNVFRKIGEYSNRRVLVIADGAAFGSEMDKVIKKIKETTGVVVYLPEPFEWLLLKSELFRDMEVTKILENPSDFIESKNFMSWERYFTHLLSEKTNGTYLQYTKSRLNEAYKSAKVQEKVLKVVPGMIKLQ